MIDVPRIPQVIAALEEVRRRFPQATPQRPVPIGRKIDDDTLDEVYGQFLIDSIHAVRVAARRLPTNNPYRSLLMRAGLLIKRSGNKAKLPNGEYVSVDSLALPTEDAEHVDIFRDAGGDTEPVWGNAHTTDGDRYLDVEDMPPSNGHDEPFPEDPKAPPAPEPEPPAPKRPLEYAEQLELCRFIGRTLDNPQAPHRDNGEAIGEVIGHLLWKVREEGYSVDKARENAEKRARGEAAD